MNIDPRIPETVQPILKDYVFLTEQRLPGFIEASYIVGSIALGEFNAFFSDIDFVTVLNRKATLENIEHLRDTHQFIEKQHTQWKMSGSYVQASDLGKLGDGLAPHPHFHDGILHVTATNAINSVTWWELKNYGIPIFGSEAQTLRFTVDWDLLIAEMRANLNSYWRSWTHHPKRIIVLYSDWGIQWAVLGVLRQYFTFKEESITTKIRAGQYALDCLPKQWHPLVQEAINIRKGKKGSLYRFRFSRMMEAVNFLKYIINSCNADSLL